MLLQDPLVAWGKSLPGAALVEELVEAVAEAVAEAVGGVLGEAGTAPRVNVISVAGGGDGDSGAAASPLAVCVELAAVRALAAWLGDSVGHAFSIGRMSCTARFACARKAYLGCLRRSEAEKKWLWEQLGLQQEQLLWHKVHFGFLFHATSTGSTGLPDDTRGRCRLCLA